MIKRYFIRENGRVDSECFALNPVNPLNWEIFTCESLPFPAHEYRKEGETLVHDPLPVPAPKSCSRRQGRLALLSAGKLETVETVIASISDATAKRQAQIEYEADTWERANPFLQSMWSSLGGTESELDGLFTLAVTL